MFDGFLKFSLEGTRHSCLQGQVHTNEEAQSQITMGVKADLKSHTLHALFEENMGIMTSACSQLQICSQNKIF